MRHLCFLLLAATVFSCDFDSAGGGRHADEVALAWAEAYFNYDFQRADRLVTPDSRKWLRYAASNLTEEDVEVIRQQEEPAQVALTGCEAVDDTTWLATLEVSGAVLLDSIGRPAVAVEAPRQYTVPVVRQGKRVYVRMEGLPRSGKRSRD